MNFYRVNCSATIAQSGQPSKPIKPSPQTAVPISSEVTTSVQTTDRAKENVPAESKRTTEGRISSEFDRIPKNVRIKVKLNMYTFGMFFDQLHFNTFFSV